MNRCMPVMHGSQGCTSFGLVLLVRHFREAIPLQTTAMNEVATIMGGMENIEKAMLNIRQRAKPDLIAICSTGLTETKGDDVDAYLQVIRRKPSRTGRHCAGLCVDAGLCRRVPGRLGQGGRRESSRAGRTDHAKTRPEAGQHTARLPPDAGRHRGSARDRRIVRLTAIVLPDVSGSLDGHMSGRIQPDHDGRHHAGRDASMGARSPPSPSASRCAPPRGAGTDRAACHTRV